MKDMFIYLMKKLGNIYAPNDPPGDPSKDAGSQVSNPDAYRAPPALYGIAEA